VLFVECFAGAQQNRVRQRCGKLLFKRHSQLFTIAVLNNIILEMIVFKC
jgi:hypothetical protein